MNVIIEILDEFSCTLCGRIIQIPSSEGILSTIKSTTIAKCLKQVYRARLIAKQFSVPIMLFTRLVEGHLYVDLWLLRVNRIDSDIYPIVEME